jgi:hypothetical protein
MTRRPRLRAWSLHKQAEIQATVVPKALNSLLEAGQCPPPEIPPRELEPRPRRLLAARVRPQRPKHLGTSRRDFTTRVDAISRSTLPAYQIENPLALFLYLALSSCNSTLQTEHSPAHEVTGKRGARLPGGAL